MSGFSKLGITLTSLFSFLLLALLSEIFYLLWRRRQQSRLKRARVEPRSPLGPNPGSEPLKFDPIHGPSRVLFTIKEEEREGVETEHALSSVSIEATKTGETLGGYFGNLHFVNVGDPDLDSDPPFSTPCASPPYFTPSSSPPREKK